MLEPRPNAESSLDFDYYYNHDVEQSPNPLALVHTFVNASVTQLFYTLNYYHDFLYM